MKHINWLLLQQVIPVCQQKAWCQAVLLLDFLCAYRPAEDLSREAKSSTDVNHNSSTAVMTPSGHGAGKTTAQAVTSSSPAATSSNSVLSNFLYGMPMSSKPHPDGKLDFKPMSLLNLGKDRLANWTSGTDKMGTSVMDCAINGKMCGGGWVSTVKYGFWVSVPQSQH